MGITADLTESELPFYGSGHLLCSSHEIFTANPAQDSFAILRRYESRASILLRRVFGSGQLRNSAPQREPSKQYCLERSDRQACLAKSSVQASLFV